jgi:hypothetical protein
MEGTEAYRKSQQAASSGLTPAADGTCVRGPKMAQAGACCGTEETRLSREPAAEENSRRNEAPAAAKTNTNSLRRIHTQEVMSTKSLPWKEHMQQSLGNCAEQERNQNERSKIGT